MQGNKFLKGNAEAWITSKWIVSGSRMKPETILILNLWKEEGETECWAEEANRVISRTSRKPSQKNSVEIWCKWPEPKTDEGWAEDKIKIFLNFPLSDEPKKMQGNSRWHLNRPEVVYDAQCWIKSLMTKSMKPTALLKPPTSMNKALLLLCVCLLNYQVDTTPSKNLITS